MPGNRLESGVQGKHPPNQSRRGIAGKFSPVTPFSNGYRKLRSSSANSTTLQCRRMRRSKTCGLGLVALALMLTGCSESNWEPNKRPAGVPPYAIWAGGPDGGSYIWCDVDAGRDVNTCTVWNDFTGSIVEKGDYRLLREHRAATKNELQFRWADRAGWIGLKDNKTLDNLAMRHPR